MRTGLCLSVASAIVFSVAGRCVASTSTQITKRTYTYDIDGAPTSVTIQVDAQPASTVYFTWDNFVPSTSDPTSGSVLNGNGNLVGVGTTPGSAFTTQFQYDQRNRLVSASTASTPSVAYTYYPASVMSSSTLSSGDSLHPTMASVRFRR
jgi:YD repeat-containing protein